MTPPADHPSTAERICEADRLFAAARHAAESGDQATAERMRQQADGMYESMEEEAKDG